MSSKEEVHRIPNQPVEQMLYVQTFGPDLATKTTQNIRSLQVSQWKLHRESDRDYGQSELHKSASDNLRLWQMPQHPTLLFFFLLFADSNLNRNIFDMPSEQKRNTMSNLH